jgi:hypothetical protein
MLDWLEVNAAPGFFPVAVASRFKSLGTAIFSGFIRLWGRMREVRSYGGLRRQRRLGVIIVHGNSLWIKVWR